MKAIIKSSLGFLVMVTAMMAFLIMPAFGATTVTVSVATSKVVASNKLSLGFQVTDAKLFIGDATLGQLAQNMSAKLIRFQSTIVEPCTRWNDGSETGTFNWATVDSLVKKIFAVGAQPLIDLGRIKDGGGGMVLPPGMAVNPATGLPYPASYAAYAAQWVINFKSLSLPVRYYEIVNEPWAYFGWTPSLTKLGNYMQLFNAVAQSMRTQNSNLILSFDFICQQQVLNYWLAHGGANLDSINFHKYDCTTTSSSTSDATLFSDAETQEFGQWPFGYSVTQAQQKYYQARGKLLPIIDSESNMNGVCASGTDPRLQQMSDAVWLALEIRMEVLNGVSYNIYYCLSSSASYGQKYTQTHGYGFGMINADNNKPWYPYYVQQMIGPNLAVGDQIVQVNSSSSSVRALGWMHNGKLYLLLICETTTPLSITFSGLQGTLSYSKIDNTVSWESPRVQTGTTSSTAALPFNGYTVMLLHG